MGASSWLLPSKKAAGRPHEGAPDHFEKLLEGPCPNHAFPVKHLYKDYALMKRFLSGGSQKETKGRSLSRQQTMPKGRTVAF